MHMFQAVSGFLTWIFTTFIFLPNYPLKYIHKSQNEYFERRCLSNILCLSLSFTTVMSQYENSTSIEIWRKIIIADLFLSLLVFLIWFSPSFLPKCTSIICERHSYLLNAFICNIFFCFLLFLYHFFKFQ